ncbi:cAMP-dependent protein kinase catalytic subunit alpha [Blattella germanica]|nr:cAMP-dependent protein kinase catalytic subunit alpha [Blattella germanica]
MKRFDENLSSFYAAQVILAIEYMHFLGLIYRDLKPENILIDKDGYLKITDLGFCKKIDKSRTYTLCGTPYYLAPEVILSKSYSFSVDWWSFGVLLYEMNAGIPPFYSEDVLTIYELIVAGKFDCPKYFSFSLKDLLHNMIEIDRTKRFGELKNGTKDIKKHIWFDSTDWEAILLRKYRPPYIPQVEGDDDASNFEKVIEKPFRVSTKDECGDMFKFITHK